MIKTYNWQQIYNAYSPKLLGICRRYIQDIHAAEDIVQDSFITAVQKNHQLKDEKAMFAWLKKIVVNNALQHLRTSSFNTFITTEPSEIPDTMDQHLLEEKNAFIYDFTHEELLSSIDSLPPHHKSVFNLYFIENYSHAEISDILGITVNTSKSHLLRAKKSIQNFLLNHSLQSNTPKNKKKITQLLIFIGFANLLWAQMFKSKFSEFSIAPTKILKIPEHIIPQSSPVTSSFRSPRKTAPIIGGVTLFIFIISSIFISYPNTDRFLSCKLSVDKVEKNISELEKQEVVQTPDNIILNRDHNIIESESQTTKEKSSEKTELSEEKVSNIKSKEYQATTQDTASGAPKKIIVVKKIIQRDTIYVER